ncbi:MAG: DUF2065 domain-containing protein [Robiginitomaculum sp.]
MPSWLTMYVIAFGGAMLLEGAMYALFPGLMKRAMAAMLAAPENVLRGMGLGLAVMGVVLVFLVMPK